MNQASLVPRPSHRPVFDRLQFAKAEEDGKTAFRTQERYMNVQNSGTLDGNYQIGFKLVFFNQGPSPSAYLGRHNITHVIKWTRPFPSVFAYCNRLKTG